MLKTILCSLCFTAILLFTFPSLVNVHGDTFQGWQLIDGCGGQLSESNGIMRFFGGANYPGGPVIYREISPQTDFEFSLQVKASQLGLNGPDDNLEGFGILLRNSSAAFRTPTGVDLELRGAGGGMFLLARYTTFWQWTSFYGAFSSWGPPFGISSPAPSSSTGDSFGMFGMYPVQSAVKTYLWYTMKLTVQKSPFKVTGQVFTENGTLLGSHSISDSTNFTFEDIKYVAIGSGWGGDFYVKNISDLPPIPEFSYSPDEVAVYQSITFDASNSSNPQGQIASYTRGFGDGTQESTSQPIIAHTFSNSGTYNVTLTVTNTNGKIASKSEMIHVLLCSSLSILTDSSSATAGSPVKVNGRLSDYEGIGLANAAVILSYTFSGLSSWLPVTSAFTDQSGNYNIQLVSPASGTFTLRVAWIGNETYAGTSNTSSLSSIPYTNQVAFFVESNSTVTSLAFNSTTSSLSFTVSGPSGTAGYARVTIAKSIVPSKTQEIKIYLDKKPLKYSLASRDNAWLLVFNYSQSSHNVNMFLRENEFGPSNLSTPASPSGTNPEALSAPNNEHNARQMTSFEPWIISAFVCSLAAILAGIVLQTRKRN